MNYQPEHAAQALRAEYNELVEVLRDSSRWHEAHDLFVRIRVNITLPSDRKRVFDLNALFVKIAENAAKTAYNCSGSSAPFDAASFERLLACANKFRSTGNLK